MVFEGNELVMYKQDGKIYGGGFTVNSIMLQHGISPITRVNVGGGSGTKKGGGVSDSFSNLAIPAGLYYFDTGLVEQSGGGKYIDKDEGYMGDDMYSKLMDLAGNVNNEYVGGAEGESDLDSDSDEVTNAVQSPSPSSGGKKYKKTKKQQLAKKGRKTRKH